MLRAWLFGWLMQRRHDDDWLKAYDSLCVPDWASVADVKATCALVGLPVGPDAPQVEKDLLEALAWASGESSALVESELSGMASEMSSDVRAQWLSGHKAATTTAACDPSTATKKGSRAKYRSYVVGGDVKVAQRYVKHKRRAGNA